MEDSRNRLYRTVIDSLVTAKMLMEELIELEPDAERTARLGRLADQTRRVSEAVQEIAGPKDQRESA